MSAIGQIDYIDVISKSTFEVDRIIQGDCLDVMKAFPDDCIDMIVTSPPYADNRKRAIRVYLSINMLIGFSQYLPS